MLEREEQQGSFEYTPEEQDSLLQLWYKNTLATDFDAVNEYNMDSVRFSSNVSDAEMMRRLSAMNSFITLPYNDVVKNYIILYSERMPSKMGRVLGLSSYYFPIFEDILLRYGLPQELKYMAIIESMLNPVATSRAGARGIWQFMYQTGVGYGLEINSFVDERPADLYFTSIRGSIQSQQQAQQNQGRELARNNVRPENEGYQS